jgi:hypothetical protein
VAYIVALICWLVGGVLFGLALGWIWPTAHGHVE